MWRSRKHKSWAKLILDERIYYACCVIAGGKEEFFLWFSGEPDGVLLSGEFVLTFRDFNALAEYCTQADLQLADEATSRYDIDAIDAWICTPHDAEFDVDMLLNAWNMMDDFYQSLRGESAIADKDLDLHEKLSLSNFATSLPGVIVSEDFEPNWTDSDRSRLAIILADALAIFKAAL